MCVHLFILVVTEGRSKKLPKLIEIYRPAHERVGGRKSNFKARVFPYQS